MNKELSRRDFLKLAGTTFAGLTLSACGVKPQRLRELEEANIYSLLLNEYPSNPLGTPILIYNKTNSGSGFDDDFMFWKIPPLEKDTLENYREVNQHPKLINLTLSTNKPYEFIDADKFDLEPKNRKYPNSIAITTFSNIGFNKELDQALAAMDYYCGGECAGSDTFFLVYSEDKWEVKIVVDGWRS